MARTAWQPKREAMAASSSAAARAASRSCAASKISTAAGSTRLRGTSPTVSHSSRWAADTAAAVRPLDSHNRARPGCGSQPSALACA